MWRSWPSMSKNIQIRDRIFISDFTFTNKCLLCRCIFPWSIKKKGKVITIFKEGDTEVLGNWRPITITSCTSKLIEKLVKKRLQSFLKKHNIMSNFQFGYRSQHSTTHAILNISENILRNLDNKKHTVSIFLDLSKGFDCVNHDILLKKLEHYGIRGLALNFFKSYLNGRRQYTCANGAFSDWLTVLCGVPQGSVLGPLLFLLYTNDLENASNFSINLLADDTSLSLSENSSHVLRRNCSKFSWWMVNQTDSLQTTKKPVYSFFLIITHDYRVPLWPYIADYRIISNKNGWRYFGESEIPFICSEDIGKILNPFTE